MKKLLAITLITLGVLIAGGYSTTVYAEPTTAYDTPNAPPAQQTDFAWGYGVSTGVHYEGLGPFPATMTHTFYYALVPRLIVNIKDDHLEWEGTGIGQADWMIKWTNIYARAIWTGTFSLKMAVSNDYPATVYGAKDVKKVDGTETIQTYYCIVTPDAAEPIKSNFVDAENFKSLIGPLDGQPDYNNPNATIDSTGGHPINWTGDLWARVTPTDSTPAGKYEDTFYITFSVIH